MSPAMACCPGKPKGSGGSNGGGTMVGAAMAAGGPPKLLLLAPMGGGSTGAPPKLLLLAAGWLAGPMCGGSGTAGGTQAELFAEAAARLCFSSQAWPLGVRGWPNLCQAYFSYATCKEQERRCMMKWIYSNKELFE